MVLVHVKLIHNPELSPFPPLPSPPLSVCARACDPQQFAHPAERLHQEKHSFMGACKLDETRGAGAHLLLVAINVSTTLGSVSVLTSPSSDVSPAAILRRMRRMILPERVLGRPVVAK